MATEVRVTHFVPQATVTAAPGEVRVTHEHAAYQGTGVASAVRVTHLYVQVAMHACVPGTGRIITSPLNDATLRPQYIGHRTTIEQTDDAFSVAEEDATWTTEAAGYTTRATLVDALTWEIAVGDVDRTERETSLFASPEVVAGEPSCLIGGPVVGGFGDVIDYGLPLYEVTAVEAGEFITLDYRAGPYAPRKHVNAVAAQFVSRVTDYESFGRGYVFPDLVVELYDPDTEELIATGSGTVRGQAGAFTPISLRSNVRPRGYRVGPGGVLMPGRMNERLITDGDSFTIDWADNQPTAGDRYRVRMYAARATDSTPFHFDGHPVDIATAIYDALGVSYDAASATTTKVALGPDLRVLLRPTAPEKALDVLEGWLYGPIGFAYRVVDGVREFYPTRARSATAPATTITLADLRGEGTPYDLSDRGLLSRVRWEEQRFNFWELTTRDGTDADLTTEQLAELAIDGLEATPSTTVFVQEDANAPANQGEQVYSLPGFIVEPLEAVADADVTFKGQQAAELFYRWGRGTVEVQFPMLPTFTTQIGEFVISEVDYSPIPEADQTPTTVRPKDYPARTPRQILQLVKRSESVAGPDCTFLVVGPVSDDVETAVGALTAPTLSIAADAAYPLNAARVTVTNWATLQVDPNNRVEIQYNIGASSPSTWNPVGTLMPASIATGTTLTPLVAAGSKVWSRARTWNLDGRFSAWSSTVSVTLTALVAPSALAGAVTGTTSEVTFTWTNGEADEPVVLRYMESAGGGWVEMATLPARTTRFVYVFPDVSTQYDVEVYHRQLTPADSVSAADSVSVTTGASTPALSAPTVPQATTADGSVTLCVTVGDVLATGTVFQLGAEQAGGSFAEWTTYAVLPPGGDRLCARTTVPLQTSPFVGTRARYWQVRAYHTGLGYTDSGYTTAITVDPWATSTPPPPIEGGSYTEGDILVADATGTLVPLPIGTNGEVLVSDGTTADWDTVAGGGLAALDDLTDVNVPTPSDGEVLTWDNGAGEWVPAAASGGGFGLSEGDAAPGSAGSLDDEGDNTASWSWRNQGGASVTTASGCIQITAPTNAGNAWRIREQTLAGNIDVSAKISLGGRLGANTLLGGLVLFRTANGKFISCGYGVSGGYYVLVQKWDDTATFNANPAIYTCSFDALLQWLYVRVVYDGTNVDFYVSGNGIAWTLLHTETAATFLGGAPDRVGIALNNNGAAADGYLLVDWFRSTT